MMKSASSVLFAFTCCRLLAGAWVDVGTMRMKTYPFSDPDPVPATGETRYPYFRYDGSTDRAEPREWKTVALENDRLRVTLLPEVGGKVWGAKDKITGEDFLYVNHVMKFRDIAMRGPWVSGGIEFNFGILGHAPSSSTPVDWCVRTNADASVSCFVSAPEYITRTVWQVEVRLGADADAFETHVKWFNASGLPSPLYHWMNAAYSLRGNPQFKFPGKNVIGHEGEIELRNWPVDEKGRDLSVYRNNAFGGPKSYHVLPGNNGFYAIWWPDKGFGSCHRSLPYEKFGRKIWLWALSREGGIWEDLLTDEDGQYTELQSGLCFNQPRWGNYKTPFKHPTFAPGATMSFAESWGPVRRLANVEKDISAPQPKARPIDPPAEFDWSSAWGHYVRGVQFLRERHDAEGAAELRAALAKDATLVCAYGALAGFEMRRGHYGDVHSLAEKALAIDAYDAEANYLDGFAYFVEGDGVTARERLGVAALSPEYASAALALVARSYLKEGEKREALRAAEKALQFNPDNLDALLARIIADRGDVGFRRRVLARFPLFHGARYEEVGKDLRCYVRNELPNWTYGELAAWYEETGMSEDARRLCSLGGDSPLLAIMAGDYAAARGMSVSGVFPFRREELKHLRKAVEVDGSWKFRYLLGALLAYFDDGEQADKLLDACANEPDESSFYLYRASRRTGEPRLADLRRAQALGDSWRVGRALAEYFEANEDFNQMLRETTDYLKRYPGKNPLQIAHGRALLKTKRYRECLAFLETVKLLPSEHRDSGTAIWHAAQDALGIKRTWPENLGQGEPYR